MASTEASRFSQPLPSPPPVYLRSSPPFLSSRHETPRRPSSHHQLNMVSTREQSPPSRSPATDEKTYQPVQVPRVRIHGEVDQPVQNFHDDEYALSLTGAAFSDLALAEKSPTHGKDIDDAPPREGELYRAPRPLVYGHTPTSSGSWSVVDPNSREQPDSLATTSSSSVDQPAPKENENVSPRESLDSSAETPEVYEPLHYHHRPYEVPSQSSATGSGENVSGTNGYLSARPRPRSTYSFTSSVGEGRHRSPHLSPYLQGRSSSRESVASPDVRPLSFVDQLNSHYPQPGPAPVQFGNSQLQSAIGNNASLLSHKQTFDMYLANVKKTDDPAVQYEFALFMVNAALDMPPDGLGGDASAVYGRKAAEITRGGLLKEAKLILQRLSDRSYPFAQYYIADGYASGLFSKGKEDYDRAFPLFVAASKHGHVEACYRAALCFEFGWGTRVEAARAQQFYRQAASKNHPGAMLRMSKACLAGDMGLGKRYREGIKWLKRAAESADEQYNSGPYELGLLHETGYGDDVFLDPSYAAQLFTKSADLGHVEASYRLGDAYEHGKLDCPRDPALSIHFYTGAAQGGHLLAMMALCAWYLIGAEPVLEKDEEEAYEWAKRAAESGLVKAQYAIGYFTETGIGCRRDPLQANVWYVKAAEQGDERAKNRLATIRAAADGVAPEQGVADAGKGKKLSGKAEGKSKRFSIF
ncbi:putative chitin synthase activator [Aspergillus uvarum CBS 121591]|uniref:Putative chitin synthase activator n=1 Tax=Aspergillus uvarum CBS 121591 TaxID=1448315 RepID=A0A319C752_9EURO|nr:putative chitin synthase activator [Aspergillus uvarum CBS 121591]PYH81646.1 putative chitin synthase activator [Aspergillus uvarum CBS 121591]